MTNLEKSDNTGGVFNQLGDRVAVVHQYDRYPAFQRSLFVKYVYWMDVSSVTAEWRQTSECESFQLFENQDKLKGVCDMKGVGGQSSPSSCCQLCLQNQQCKGFTFAAGTCYLKSCSNTNFNMRSAQLLEVYTGIRKESSN